MKIKFNNQDSLKQYIVEGLHKHDKKVGYNLFEGNEKLGTKVGFEALENDKTIGGVTGKISDLDYLHISLLQVEEAYRGKNIGTKLVQKMEEYAKKKNLSGVTINTLSYQAKGFYLKLGYTIYGEFTDKKTSVSKYFFIKQF